MVKAETEVQSQASPSTGISPRRAQAMEISKPNMRRNVVVMREESADKEDESNADIQVVAKRCPITFKRIPAVSAASHITNPGAARCTIIEGDDSDGSMRRFKDYTPMQQHILFWDRDADGKIYPYDTYVGFRQLGFNILFSFLAVLVINLNFSYPTRLAHSYLPDPRFRVYVDSIYKAKHGSDSGTYDAEGRFIPQAFEDMFGKYDGDNDGTLTLRELFEMMHGNRCAADPFGWGAAFFEWGTTWLLIQKDGKVYKEDLQGVYDGSIFWKIEEARKTPEGWTQGYGLGGDGFVGGVKVF